MTDNIAILNGFTVEVFGEYKDIQLNLLVKPGTDFGDRFQAWDMNTQEYIQVNGWLAIFNEC